MDLRLPTLGTLIEAAASALRRFPLVILAAGLAAFSAILTAEELGPAALRDRLLAAASLGLPLLAAVALAAERKANRIAAQAGGGAAAFVVLAIVYASWPGWAEEVRPLRYLQLSLAFHLMAAFLPFAGAGSPGALWRYNRALAERAVITLAAAAVLFAGLALALGALDKLFGVDVPGEGYFRLWAVIAFVFATWFFLAGVPRDLDALGQRLDYPPALRLFAQYILVPLVTVYLVILTLYLGKVVVTWDWPSGWIGFLVSGVATAGILTLLLVHPAAEDPEQKWIAVFARDFWLAIIPSVVMLWLALYQRIAQYGFTEPRYFLLGLSVWLAGMAAYYTVTRSRGIAPIPATLCVVALLGFAGPWSAYRVAMRSQAGRLEGILARNGMLVDGAIRRPAAAVDSTDEREISATLRWLAERRALDRVAPWFGDTLSTRLRLAVRPTSGQRTEDRVRALTADLGVAYFTRRGAGRWGERYSYTAGASEPVAIQGYDLLLRIRQRSDTTEPDTGLVARVAPGGRALRVTRDGEALMDIPLDSALRAARRARVGGFTAVPGHLLRASAEAGGIEALALLRSVSGTDSVGVPLVESASGEVLLRTRP